MRDPDPTTPWNEAYVHYTGSPPNVNPAKMVQLNGALLKAGKLDAMYGLPKMADITDGTSNTIMMYEDCSLNEQMSALAYFDSVNQSASLLWRWANPDCASGVSKPVNNCKAGGFGPAFGTCDWTNHDVGPNSEIFSFHGNGANVVFADGHVVFLRESIGVDVLLALCSRSNGRNEATIDPEDVSP